MTAVSRQFHLVRRPEGLPRLDDFDLVSTPLPSLEQGQVLIENIALSVDPYMRPRMDDVPSYIPPFALDAPMDGGAVGRVVDSMDASLPIGTAVVHMAGWRDLAVVRARHCSIVQEDEFPLSYHLGVLGMPGLTAYVGLIDIGALAEGDTVFVSAAAGAVGSLAGQFARLLGAARVVGSVGSRHKAAYVVDRLGFDAALDYSHGDLRRQLAEYVPDGIDVYFDNVGGDTLSAALSSMRDFGRIVLCGAISEYNVVGGTSSGAANLFEATRRRLRLQGFIVSDHGARRSSFEEQARAWLREGALAYDETIRDGLEATPEAMLGLLRGENTGKMIVRLREPT